MFVSVDTHWTALTVRDRAGSVLSAASGLVLRPQPRERRKVVQVHAGAKCGAASRSQPQLAKLLGAGPSMQQNTRAIYRSPLRQSKARMTSWS